MNLPDKFTFDSRYNTGFLAEKDGEYYMVSWSSEDGNMSSRQHAYPIDYVSKTILKGIWVNIKKVKQPSFSIKEGNIEKAAQFIIANNKYMADKTVNYMTFSIKETIRRQIERIKNGEDAWYCSTAGYSVIIFQEDEDYYSVEVLVSPDVSSDAEFLNVEDML